MSKPSSTSDTAERVVYIKSKPEKLVPYILKPLPMQPEFFRSLIEQDLDFVPHTCAINAEDWVDRQIVYYYDTMRDPSERRVIISSLPRVGKPSSPIRIPHWYFWNPMPHKRAELVFIDGRPTLELYHGQKSHPTLRYVLVQEMMTMSLSSVEDVTDLRNMFASTEQDS